MTATPITSRDILRCLTSLNGLVPARRYLCCPNVSWAMLPWEADLLAISEAGYFTEVEIKISHSDLKRDLLKRKHRNVSGWGSDRIKFFWYAMPARVYELAEAAGTLAQLPPDAGIATIQRDDGGRDRLTVRKIADSRRGRPATDGERMELLRLVAFRYWDQFLDEPKADLSTG